MSYSIYMIRCVKNGKVYIGKSKNPYSRIGDHFTILKAEAKGTLKCRRQHSPDMTADYAKYGEIGFETCILKSGIPDEHSDFEEGDFIREYRACEPEFGYNTRQEKTTRNIRPFFIPCEGDTLYMKIRFLCKQNGISVSELEKRVGLGNATIRGWATCSPSVENLKKVTDFFNCTLDDLLADIYGKTIRKRMIDADMTVAELCQRITEVTGKYFDSSFLSKICNGKIKNSEAIPAINDILEIKEETT